MSSGNGFSPAASKSSDGFVNVPSPAYTPGRNISNGLAPQQPTYGYWKGPVGDDGFRISSSFATGGRQGTGELPAPLRNSGPARQSYQPPHVRQGLQQQGRGQGYQQGGNRQQRRQQYHPQRVSVANGGFAEPSGGDAVSSGVHSSDWRRGAGPNNGSNANGRQVRRGERLQVVLQSVAASGYGDIVIRIDQERAREGASPDAPSFLSLFADVSEDEYYATVLPYIAKCTFVIKSQPDLTWFHDMCISEKLPQVTHAITKLVLPEMYQFSGVGDNRLGNPYLIFASRLPALEELTVVLHQAGLVLSMYNDHQRAQLQYCDDEAAMSKRAMSLQQVMRQYDLKRIFDCKGLKLLHLQCITSAFTARYTRVGNPLDTFQELVAWIKSGIQSTARNSVTVDGVFITPE